MILNIKQATMSHAEVRVTQAAKYTCVIHRRLANNWILHTVFRMVRLQQLPPLYGWRCIQPTRISIMSLAITTHEGKQNSINYLSQTDDSLTLKRMLLIGCYVVYICRVNQSQASSHPIHCGCFHV